jgi:hypothetical protein
MQKFRSDALASIHETMRALPIDRLASETGLTRQTIITHLSLAKNRGWISSKPHGLSGQAWKRNEYSLSWPKGTERPSAASRKGGQAGLLPSGKKVVNLTRRRWSTWLTRVLQ